MNPGPRYEQTALFGHAEPVGFGTDAFYVELIPHRIANQMIKQHHYSGTITTYSTEHFGVYIDGEIVGSLQWGHALNSASGASIVEGARTGDWRELNRMWLDDSAPRNSESMAISYCLKWFRIARRNVEWVQSFADERCGGLGVVYQACSFLYLGEHTNVFWELDGRYYHDIIRTHTAKATNPTARKLKAGLGRATKHKLRQFRYFRALTKRARRGLLMTPQPYPKRKPLDQAQDR